MGDDVKRFRRRYPDIQSHIDLISEMELFDRKLDCMKDELDDLGQDLLQ